MARRTVKPGNDHLVERLNRAPQGAPPSQVLDRILGLLRSEGEADLLSRLPIRPFTAHQAARAWQTDEAAARRQLDHLADRALLVDIARQDTMWYVRLSPMAGFFEFAFMRARRDRRPRLRAGERGHPYPCTSAWASAAAATSSSTWARPATSPRTSA
ncbi:MAG: hypothetical protein R3D98_04730 [Candidatus Krumholzibacteriia bacterium]